MKTRKNLKLISVLMITLIALSSTSCASNKRKYEVIKETDLWYDVNSFEVSDLYPADQYNYAEFETIGATSDAVYVKVEAEKPYPGGYSKMTEEETEKTVDYGGRLYAGSAQGFADSRNPGAWEAGFIYGAPQK